MTFNLQRIGKLVTGGILTTPYVGKEHRRPGLQRYYNRECLEKLKGRMDVLKEDYFYPVRRGRKWIWTKINKDVMDKKSFYDLYLPCLVLRKTVKSEKSNVLKVKDGNGCISMVEKHNSLNKWYQERVNNWLPYFNDLAQKLVKKYSPRLVLDIGCSDGLLLYCFWRRGVDVCGVDISKRSMNFAPEEIKPNLILTDVERNDLPFKDNTFDLITILEVLEHLHNHDRVIREIRRVLKPKGYVLISSPKESKLLGLINRLTRTKQKQRPNYHDYELFNYSPHINVHPPKFWVKGFESNGLKLIEDFKKTHSELIKQTIASHPPEQFMAKFLMKFGSIGRKLRLELAYYLWGSALLFRKEG